MSPTQNEKLLATISHLSTLIPRYGFVIPLIIWVIQLNKKEKSEYVLFQSFEATTFQFCQIAIGSILYIFSIISIYFFGTSDDMTVFFPVSILNFFTYFLFLAYGIFAATMTFQGKSFRYWFIGDKLEKSMPSIMNIKPSLVFIFIIVLGIIYSFCALLIFIMATIGQMNA